METATPTSSCVPKRFIIGLMLGPSRKFICTYFCLLASAAAAASSCSSFSSPKGFSFYKRPIEGRQKRTLNATPFSPYWA